MPVRVSTPGSGVNVAGWETFDDSEDDDPGVKTTIARPFDEDRESEGSNKLPLFVVGGVGIGLVALFGLMYGLELGPFTPKAAKVNPVVLPEARR